MEDIDKIVLKMIGSQANQNQYNLYKLKACWSEIVGKNNARHCIPVKLERRILTLSVDSSVWANQFLYYKLQFIEKINIFTNVKYVKDIKFVIGNKFRRSKKRMEDDIQEKEKNILIPELTEEEKNALKIKFRHIKNEKIRASVIKAEEKRYGLEKLYKDGKIKKCILCGAFIKDNKKICVSCELEKQKKKENEMWKWIVKEPWISWNEIQAVIKCSENEFDMIKNDVKAYYFEKVKNQTSDEKENKISVQLKAGKPYALIPETERDNILKFLQKGKL